MTAQAPSTGAATVRTTPPPLTGAGLCLGLCPGRLRPRGGHLPGHPGQLPVVAVTPCVQLVGQGEEPLPDAVGAELGGCGDGVVG